MPGGLGINIPRCFSFLLLTLLSVWRLHAQVVLIDYDDGVANGQHEASIRNGGFEDTSALSGTTITDVPYWDSFFDDNLAGGSSTNGPWLSDTGGNSGPHRSVISGWQAINNLPRRQIYPVIPAHQWVIKAGDIFNLRFAVKAGSGFDTNDVVKVDWYAVNGGVSTDMNQDMLVDVSDAGDWTMANLTLNISGSTYAGQQIAYRLLVDRDAQNPGDATRDEFALIDDFFFSATPPRQRPCDQ